MTQLDEETYEKTESNSTSEPPHAQSSACPRQNPTPEHQAKLQAMMQKEGLSTTGPKGLGERWVY